MPDDAPELLNALGYPIDDLTRYELPLALPDAHQAKHLVPFNLRTYNRPKVKPTAPKPDNRWGLEILPTLDYKPSIYAAQFHNSTARFRALVWGLRSGKCITADQGVLLANGGIKRADALAVGDRILGLENQTSRPIRVTALEPAKKECLEITLVDGSVIRCSSDHRFPFWNYKTNSVQIWEIGKALGQGPGLKYKLKFLKPRQIQYTRPKGLSLEPYFLGLLLGDGGISTTAVVFSTASEELLGAVQHESMRWGLKLKHYGQYDYRLSSEKQRDHRGYNFNPLRRALDDLGLRGANSHTKFIPKHYLTASLTSRLRLLAGLIDTDGHVYNNAGSVEYCTMSKQLAADVQYLVRSLGGYCSIHRGNVGQYRLGISINRDLPTKVPYKKLSPIKFNRTRIGIKSWRSIGERECIHISVDAPNELFLLDNFVATHNTIAGAVETVRAALAVPGELHWVVAPTHRNLQAPEAEVIRILALTGTSFKRRTGKRELRLSNGSHIQFVAAEYPDNLRGPTIVGSLWCDETGYAREEAWYVLRTRVSIGDTDMWLTTTPKGRNWFWPIVRGMGLPTNQPYGEWEGKHSFVSHRPTWDFSWVPSGEVESWRRTWPKRKFLQEIGAMFSAPDIKVFNGVENCLTLEMPPETLEGVTVMGLDLAQKQDFTALIIMDANGRVHHIDRWTGESWRLQIEKITNLARKWNAVIAYDNSNIGGPIGEELQKADGVTALPVECNSPQVKAGLIEGLQLAIERALIKLPDPSTAWCPDLAQPLLEELDNYEPSLTRGGRLAYSAPQGLNDDLVIALALANHARARGYGGAATPAVVSVPRGKWQDPNKASRPKRPSLFDPNRWHRSATGMKAPGFLWRE